MSGEPRYSEASGPSSRFCLDCGVAIESFKAHTRFHAVLNDQARAVAMLLSSHISAGVHDRYDVNDRFDRGRNENNWSAEAFAEVVAEHEETR